MSKKHKHKWRLSTIDTELPTIDDGVQRGVIGLICDICERHLLDIPAKIHRKGGNIFKVETKIDRKIYEEWGR